MAADDKDPSQKDLLKALTEALNRSNSLASENAVALEEAKNLIAEQSKAIEELKAGPKPVAIVPQPGPQKVPYKGLVRAKEACYIGSLRGPGEVWNHETDCLWSDDPFEPVIAKGTREDGSIIAETHPDAPTAVPFHLRPRSADALTLRAATPQTASQW